MKRIISTCIVLILLNGTLLYSWKEDDIKKANIGGQVVTVQVIGNFDRLGEVFGAIDYHDLLTTEEVTFAEIVDVYELEKSAPKCMATDAILMSDGSSQELYVIWHERDDGDVVKYTYSGILVNYSDNSSRLLFQADKLYDSAFESFYEFFDLKICDVDGNGEEDFILFLGTHVSTGREYYLPNLFCMIGLQNDGSFQFVTNRNDKWLEEITSTLYNQTEDGWQIEKILEHMKAHYGNQREAEWASYDYFSNANQEHYNLTLESDAAFAVKNYSIEAGLENEQWELKRIFCNNNSYHVFVESQNENELYMILSYDKSDFMPKCSVVADIRKNSNAEILLQGNSYSYNSMLEWYSYADLFYEEIIMEKHINLENSGELYDSIYENAFYYALYDYLNRTGKDTDSVWTIDGNSIYVGKNGYIADISCVCEEERINLCVDVWNKIYTVLE